MSSSADSIRKSSNRHFIWLMLAFLLLEGVWIWGLFVAPVDRIQGEVYRIIYLHVPSAFTSLFFCPVLLLFHSIAALRKGTLASAVSARAAAEIGFMFTAITLLSGAIWGKPTWGVYWVWDARLTTTFILSLLFVAYIILYHSIDDVQVRGKVCGILGVLTVVNVPIIYYSVTWWRTLHQPPSMFREGGSTIDPQMQAGILVGAVVSMFFAYQLMRIRKDNMLLKTEIESKGLMMS